MSGTFKVANVPVTPIAAAVDAMLKQGVAHELIVTVVNAMERCRETTSPHQSTVSVTEPCTDEAPRTANAERQRRYRERNKTSPPVTRVTSRNVTNNVTNNVTRNVTERNEPLRLHISSFSEVKELAEEVVEGKEESKQDDLNVSGSEGALTVTGVTLPVTTVTPSPVTPKRYAGVTLPDDWKPNERHYEKGNAKGIPRSGVDRLAEDMRDWAKANANRAIAKKASWDLTFNGWISRERTNGSGFNGNQNTNAGRATARDLEKAAAMGRGAIRIIDERRALRALDAADEADAQRERKGGA